MENNNLPIMERAGSTSPPASDVDGHGPQHLHLNVDEDGLILPKKLINPCLESKEIKDLHRELKINQRIGKDVLHQKCELTKVLEKRARAKEQKEKEAQEGKQLQRKTSFERKLQEQALKIMAAEQGSRDGSKGGEDSGHGRESDQAPEFLRIHAKICEKKIQQQQQPAWTAQATIDGRLSWPNHHYCY